MTSEQSDLVGPPSTQKPSMSGLTPGSSAAQAVAATLPAPSPTPPAALQPEPVPSSCSRRDLDITDLPPDVLPLLFSHLAPGHRLDLRAVSREWAIWADCALACSTHLNIVLDVPLLRRALLLHQRRQQQQQQSAEGAATAASGGGGAPPPPAGLLAGKFPAAANVRLWVGCRPSAALAGRNGGVTATPAIMPYHRKAIVSALDFVATSARLLKDSLVDVADWWLAKALQALAPRQPPWEPPPSRRQRRAAEALAPRWHVHRGASGGSGDDKVALLRRYAPDPSEPGLAPLAACLVPSLIGSSTSLVRLSVVTAHDLTLEDLALLRESFPRLSSLALHAHKDVTLDFKPATMPSLEPLLPPPAPSAPAGVAATPPPAAPPPPPVHPALMLHTLVLSGLRLDWPPPPPPSDRGVGGAGRGLAAMTHLRALVLHRTTCRMHRMLPEIQALTQLTRLELRGLDYHPIPLDPADERVATAKKIFLERLRQQRQQLRNGSGGYGSCDDSGGGGGGSRRSVGTLTAETSRSESSEDEDEWVESCRIPPGCGHCAAAAAAAAPWLRPSASYGSLSHPWRGARPDWRATMRALGRALRRLSELRVLVCDVECPSAVAAGTTAAPSRAAAAHTLPPPLEVTQGKARGSCWDLLMAGVLQLRNLQELRLPYLVLHDAAQPAELAAALPRLTSLELAALPPAQPPPPVPYYFRGMTRAAAAKLAADAMWRRYLPLEAEAEEGAEGAAAAAAAVMDMCARAEQSSNVQREGEAGARDWDAGDDGEGSDGTSRDGGRRGGGGSRGRQDEPYWAPMTDFEAQLERDAEAQVSENSGLEVFMQLRELVLHRAGVRQLSYWLPLPPRLRRLEVPVQRPDAPMLRGELASELCAEALALLRMRLLPAWSRVPDVRLTLGRAVASVSRQPNHPAAQPSTTRGDNDAAADPGGSVRTPSTGPATASRTRAPSRVRAQEPAAGPAGAAAPDAAASSSCGSREGSHLHLLRRGEVLAVAMLATALCEGLTSLDLSPVMWPGALSEQEALACLRIAAEGLPRLRRLSCYLYGGTRGPMDPEWPAASGSFPAGQTESAGSSGISSISSSSGGVRAPSWQGRQLRARGPALADAPAEMQSRPPEQHLSRPCFTAVQCFNAMPLLEELRVKVLTLATRPPFAPRAYVSSKPSYHTVRVPLAFLRALTRPVRVVDCSPLDAWCASDGAVHPRDALRAARVALAAEGRPCVLVSEAEDWAARAMGLGPDMEATWRGAIRGRDGGC